MSPKNKPASATKKGRRVAAKSNVSGNESMDPRQQVVANLMHARMKFAHRRLERWAAETVSAENATKDTTERDLMDATASLEGEQATYSSKLSEEEKQSEWNVPEYFEGKVVRMVDDADKTFSFDVRNYNTLTFIIKPTDRLFDEMKSRVVDAGNDRTGRVFVGVTYFDSESMAGSKVARTVKRITYNKPLLQGES